MPKQDQADGLQAFSRHNESFKESFKAALPRLAGARQPGEDVDGNCRCNPGYQVDKTSSGPSMMPQKSVLPNGDGDAS
jgi:hypothetical protein